MENKEPSRDDKAEQEAGNKKYEEKAEQLLKLQRHYEILNPMFLGILSVYILFVTALVAFGAIAFYGGHKTILEIVVFASMGLLFAVPVGVAWYLLSFRKKPKENVSPGKQSLVVRMAKSSFSRFIVRLWDNPIVRVYRLFSFLLCIYMVAWLIIRVWPTRPRWSLGFIVIFTSLFLVNLILEISNSLLDDIRKLFSNQSELISVQRDLLTNDP